VVRGLFEQFKTEKLKALAVWLPMMSEDDLERATAAAESFRDDRVYHGWDPERELAMLFGKALNLAGAAWDVYLLYPPAVTWTADVPPQPAFWMHQLPTTTAIEGTHLFNPGLFAQELLHLLQSENTLGSRDLALLLHVKGLLAVRNESGRYSLRDIAAAVQVRAK